MTDAELDTLLRQWGTRKLDAAPEATMPDLVTRPRRPWWPALAAAAVVVVVAGTLVVLRGGLDGRPQPSSTAAPTPTPPPAGTRESVFHGLAIDVPKAWRDNVLRCGVPQADTVAVPQGAVQACATPRPATVTAVEWVRLDDSIDRSPIAPAHTTSIEIGGHAAQRTVGTRRGFAVVHVDVPALRAGVDITSPSPELARRLAATLHVVAVDQNGCPTRSSLRELADLGEPGRAGTSDQIVPGTPESVTICRYVSGYLEQSARLEGRALSGATKIIDDLPTGLSRAIGYLPRVCDPRDPWFEDRDFETFVLEVQYPKGPALTLLARIGFCGQLGVTNGARTGQRDYDLYNLLARATGSSGLGAVDVQPIPR